MSKSPVTSPAKHFHRLLPALVSLPVFLAALPASAQQVENEVSVQRFDPAPGAGNLFVTRSASAVQGHMAWTAGMLVNYAYEPFTVVGANGDDIPVVENMVTGDVLGSLSLIEQLQLGLKIPVTWDKGQGISEDGTPADEGISATGLGDIQLEAKGRFYGEPGEMIVLGAYLFGTAPMGTITAENSYIGNAGPTFGGAFVADGAMGPFSYGANLGGAWRKEATIGGSEIGPELRVSAGGAFAASPIISVVADVFGVSSFGGGAGSGGIEVDAGARILPLGNQLSFTVGGGAGVLKGVGIPTARAFLGVTYNATTQDRDEDGIEDKVDACPDAAEDMDGFEDGDGCPEFDNDQDGLPDDADKCPDKPEDVDSFEDKDGCPEPDNDKDGIPDAKDHCPLQPETKNDFDDLDGCPDVKDTDADGVPDDTDKCIDEPEDTDGFEDLDGCPDPDNDGDGVPDNQDECIDEAEDGKGKDQEKTDGCPQEA